VPEVVGYKLITEIYRSGVVSIYRAQQITTNATVIIKRVEKRQAQLGVIDQLHNEYDVLSQLPDHPAIPKVVEFIEDDLSCCLVKKYFEGIVLAELINNYQLSQKLVIDILIQIIEALSFLHINKIIHKDLKPANILWNESDKKIQIIDFGLSVPIEQKN
jgi:serine/threonine protein kinase